MSKLNLTSASYIVPSVNGEPGDINARESLSSLEQVYSGEYTRCKTRYDNIGTEKDKLRDCVDHGNSELQALKINEKELEDAINDNQAAIENCEENIRYLTNLNTSDLETEIQNNESNRQSKQRDLQVTHNNRIKSLNEERQSKLDDLKCEFDSLNRDVSDEDLQAIRNPNQIQEIALANINSREEAKLELDKLVESKVQSSDYAIAELETKIKSLNNDVQNVNNKYNPLIAECQRVVDTIHKKYAGSIQSYSDKINESIANQDSEIQSLNTQLDVEVKSANTQISNLNSEIKKVNRDYAKQIREAESQGKATTRLKQSKTSKISSLEADITKIKNNYEKVKTKIERQAQLINDRYSKEQEKLKVQKDNLISKRDAELKEPTRELNSTVQEKELKIADLVTNINNCKRAIDDLNNDKANYINEKTKNYDNTIAELDRSLREFASSTDIAIDEIEDQDLVIFQTLESRLETWRIAIRKLCKNENKIESLSTSAEQDLNNKSFTNLLEDANKAKSLPDNPSFLASGKIPIIIIGIIIAISGGVTTALSILEVIAGIGILVAGLVMVVAAIIIHSMTLKKYVRAERLITNYISINGVVDHSNETILNEKVKVLLELGSKLRSIQFALFDGKMAYNQKVAELNTKYNMLINKANADYTEKLQYINEEHNNILNMINQKISNFKYDTSKSLKAEKTKLSSLKSSGKNLFNQFKTNKENIKDCEAKLFNAETRLGEALSFEEDAPNLMINFKAKTEELLRELVIKCAKEENTAITKDTECVLSDSIFLGLGNEYLKDSNGVQRVMKYQHNKKPIIIVYDENIQKLPGKTVVESLNIELSKLVIDLVTSFRFINSKDSLKQYIIDLPICADELAGEQKKKMNCIRYYTNRLDDMKKYFEEFRDSRAELTDKGVSHIDTLNRNNFKKGIEPKQYNIVYFILRPDEDITRPLDNVVLSNCDKYGFLPIFILSNKMWNGTEDGRSSFINNLVDNNTNPIIKYTNRQYIVSEV